MQGWGQLFTHHGVNQLDTVVLRGVVARGHHNTNPLSTELLRTQTGKKTHGKNDSVEQVTIQARWSEQHRRQQKDDRGVCGGGADRW